MDRASALAKLPGDYALLILLHEAGAPPAAIADRLGVEVQDLPTMESIAQAKLAALLNESQPER